LKEKAKLDLTCRRFNIAIVFGCGIAWRAATIALIERPSEG